MSAIPQARAIPPRPNAGLSASRASSAPWSGKATIGGKSVPARFELLPDEKPRWGRMGVSALGQLFVLGLALLSPMIFPQEMRTALKFDVIELAQPVTEIPVEPPPKPTPPPPPPARPKIKKPKVQPKAPELKQEAPEPPQMLPQLSPRQPHVFLNLKPQLPKIHAVEAKAVELKPVLKQAEVVLSSNGPARPKEDVKVGALGGGIAGPGTVAANKVQTGGFGDPNGIRGPGNANKAGNINQGGSPGLPGGPGSGNGTGGAQGLRGAVAGGGGGGGKGGAEAGNASASVAILYKPNPAYSSEGRALKMEGDVVLEVVFLATGQLQVTRVVNGLGHGLDEAAMEAAKRIRFTPAKRNGQAVDFPARVRIEFRLSK